MAQPRVPQFGKWDTGGDVPYTQCFDAARKNKGGGDKMINPNDPQENPSAFNDTGRGYANPPVLKPVHRAPPAEPRRPPERRPDNPPMNPQHQPRKVVNELPPNGGYGTAPNTPGRPKLRPTGRPNAAPDRAPALPKFGDWDDPAASGGGYTVIFNEVRNIKKGDITPDASVPVQGACAAHGGGKTKNGFFSKIRHWLMGK